MCYNISSGVESIFSWIFLLFKSLTQIPPYLPCPLCGIWYCLSLFLEIISPWWLGLYLQGPSFSPIYVQPMSCTLPTPVAQYGDRGFLLLRTQFLGLRDRHVFLYIHPWPTSHSTHCPLGNFKTTRSHYFKYLVTPKSMSIQLSWTVDSCICLIMDISS